MRASKAGAATVKNVHARHFGQDHRLTGIRLAPMAWAALPMARKLRLASAAAAIGAA